MWSESQTTITSAIREENAIASAAMSIADNPTRAAVAAALLVRADVSVVTAMAQRPATGDSPYSPHPALRHHPFPRYGKGYEYRAPLARAMVGRARLGV